MKRFFTVLMVGVLMLGVSQPVAAQESGRWRANVGVGWFSLPDFVGMLIAGLGTIDTTEGTSTQDFIPLLNPNLGVLCGVNDWFAVGGSMSIGYAAATSHFDDTGVVSRRTRALYLTLTLDAKARYVAWNNLSLYGSVGVGAMALSSNQFYDGSNHPNLQFAPMCNLYPLCLSIGNETGGFVEFGWGSKGFVNIGGYFSF